MSPEYIVHEVTPLNVGIVISSSVVAVISQVIRFSHESKILHDNIIAHSLSDDALKFIVIVVSFSPVLVCV